jgi:hypothetical protein
MKITKTQIRRIIREELNRVLSEIRDVSGEEMADALSADFPEGAFQSGMDEIYGPKTYIDEFVQRYPELAEKFGSLQLFQQLQKSYSNLNKAAQAMPRDERRRKFTKTMDLVDWVVDDMADRFSRKTPTPQTHAEISGLGLENVPPESRGMFMPGKFMHTFINKPGNEGITPERAMELFQQAHVALRQLPRAEFMQLRQSKPELMQWTADKMQELA